MGSLQESATIEAYEKQQEEEKRWDREESFGARALPASPSGSRTGCSRREMKIVPAQCVDQNLKSWEDRLEGDFQEV